MKAKFTAAALAFALPAIAIAGATASSFKKETRRWDRSARFTPSPGRDGWMNPPSSPFSTGWPSASPPSLAKLFLS